MCTNLCKKRIRRYDGFGAPIGVTFKGDAYYKTVCGGIATLLMILLLGGNLALNTLDFLIKNQFEKKISQNYIPITQER